MRNGSVRSCSALLAPLLALLAGAPSASATPPRGPPRYECELAVYGPTSPAFVANGPIQAALCCVSSSRAAIPRVTLRFEGPPGALDGASQLALDDVPSGAWQGILLHVNATFLGLATIAPNVVLKTGATREIRLPLAPLYALGTGTYVLVGTVSTTDLRRVYAGFIDHGTIDPAPQGGGAEVTICADSIPSAIWDGSVDDPLPDAPHCSNSGALLVDGTLPFDDVAHLVAARRPELRACVRAPTAGDVNPPRVYIEYVLKGTHPRQVNVTTEDVGDTVPGALSRCLKRVIEQTTFPAAGDRALTFVRVRVKT